MGTANVTRLLAKNKNALGIQELMPDRQQLAQIERLSPRGTAVLFDAFVDQHSKDKSGVIGRGGRTAGQRQPLPGARRYIWTCHRANDCRKESGIFKAEISMRKQTHLDRRGRRGAALSIFPG